MENELMKENEMTNAIQTIQVVQGSVVFGSYEELKRQATNLASERTRGQKDFNQKNDVGTLCGL